MKKKRLPMIQNQVKRNNLNNMKMQCKHIQILQRKQDGYDNTYTCLSYLNSSDQKWYNESHAFNLWRDAVWHKCHELLNAYMAGEMEKISIDELISRLPEIDWTQSK